MSALYSFAILRVISESEFGHFLDQNSEKDLLLPKSEQNMKIQVGDEVLVAIFQDKQERPCASMRIERYADQNTAELKPEQEVMVTIYAETDLGYKALINNRYSGLLYKNEVFQQLRYLQETKAYIKAFREDGKIDLILQPFGNKGADDIGVRILEKLEENQGFLAITDKTDADIIYKIFQVSKKKFKIALGGIYKKRLITIKDDGIYLN